MGVSESVPRREEQGQDSGGHGTRQPGGPDALHGLRSRPSGGPDCARKDLSPTDSPSVVTGSLCWLRAQTTR